MIGNMNQCRQNSSTPEVLFKDNLSTIKYYYIINSLNHENKTRDWHNGKYILQCLWIVVIVYKTCNL